MNKAELIMQLAASSSALGVANFVDFIFDTVDKYRESQWNVGENLVVVGLDDSSYLISQIKGEDVLLSSASDPDDCSDYLIDLITGDPSLTQDFLLALIKANMEVYAPPECATVTGCLSDEEARVLIDAGYLPPGDFGQYTGPGCPHETARELLAQREKDASRRLAEASLAEMIRIFK
jgi:hypothetical protein